MSDKDKPFGPEQERTIITPNPGMRRPPASPKPARSPHSDETPPAAPYTPATAPAYQPQALPPQPKSTPYGLPDPRSGRYGSPEQGDPRQSVADDWIVSANQVPDPTAALPRAEDLRFDELAAQHENPIMRAAGPLLHLLGRLRVAMLRASFASLMEQVAAAINFFESEIRLAGVPVEQANVAKYLICATADDIVQNIPTEDRHVWTQYSMGSRFFGERIAGVRFFEELDRLKREPAVNYNVLELQHACLALGFQGVHRTSSGGAAQLQLIQRDLYETLRRVRRRITLELSPRWKGQELTVKQPRLRFPAWALAGVLAFALLDLFLALRASLSSQSETVANEVINLHPAGKVALQRRLPAPRVEPTPAVEKQMNEIKAKLPPYIYVRSYGPWIAISIGSGILFESGQARVLPQFQLIANQLAQVVNGQAGPVRIVGHTDNQPLSPLNRFKDNQQLSVERANAVAALIRPKLSDSTRVEVYGKGPDQPVAPNTTPEGRAHNRRVEVLIKKIEE
ncbi:MAG: type IVB secretion system protein IcmH/DotU [Methylocella sp.]